MKQMKSQSLFFLLFILHQCLCQQSSQQYSAPSTQQYGQQASQQQQYTQPSQNKLEDIERDTLKSAQAQPQSTTQQSQSQQYLAYPQDQLLYSIQPQQAALFQAPQQQVATSLYAAQPTTTPLVSPQQQQYFVQPYYSQAPQSYPYIDFGGFPLYPSLIPYVVPQNGATQNGQVPQNAVNDYFKTIQQSSQLKPQVQSTVKASPATQVPSVGNFILSNTIPNGYYQPVSFTQPQNPQFYGYNSFYQVQNPSKSAYSSGIKSTTPSAPIKGKDDQFVPVSNGNYRYDFATAEQNNYNNKVRLSG